VLLRTIVAVSLVCALLEPAVRAAHASAQSSLRARAGIAGREETDFALALARAALAR
jgi:hypothetical protein